MPSIHVLLGAPSGNPSAKREKIDHRSLANWVKIHDSGRLQSGSGSRIWLRGLNSGQSKFADITKWSCISQASFLCCHITVTVCSIHQEEQNMEISRVEIHAMMTLW